MRYRVFGVRFQSDARDVIADGVKYHNGYGGHFPKG
jgi:hypothetical protein